MTLDLSAIRQPETDVARQYAPEAFEGRAGQFRVVSPVDLRFKVYKDRERYRLSLIHI